MSEKNLIDRLTEQVKGNRDLALSLLRDRGHVYPDSEELTPEGLARDKLGAAGRAIDRVISKKGGRTSDYVYDPFTNKAVKWKL